MKNGPPPAFAQARNRRQLVDDTGGDDQPPRQVLVGTRAHGEPARHRPRVGHRGVSPGDRRVGEELGPPLARDRSWVLPVLAQEAV